MIFNSHKGVYIIAEIGINHNGDIDAAKTLFKEAVKCGANGIKIQVRDLDSMYRREILKDSTRAEQNTQYLLSELKKANLTFEKVQELFVFAQQYPVDFFATPFDLPSVDLLQKLNSPVFKIGSADFTNLPLIEKIVDLHKPIILSTGMATEEEIIQVVSFLKNKKADFSILHCNSTYPAAAHSINLNYLPSLKRIVGPHKIGYSGHERGFIPSLSAVALGAQIIERHITLDKGQSGPDHESSLLPVEFSNMVQSIREVELTLGSPQKICNQGEHNNRMALGKSLVVTRDLQPGDVIKKSDLIGKSPAKGISPLERDFFLGKTITKPVKKDEYLFKKHVTANGHHKPVQLDYCKNWGIVGRLNDFEEFLYLKPQLMEIHMTWRDLDNYQRPEKSFNQDLVVHAPEYYQDQLVDFSSSDTKVTEYSLEMLNKTIEVARDLAPCFRGVDNPRGPRVVVHPGGHFRTPTLSNKSEQYQKLIKNLKSVDTSGVRILMENMPPLPWYFGGMWHNTIFMDAREISQFAKEMNWEICFDTSHAKLYCNHADIAFSQFTRTIYEHVGYLHISDALGSTEEGLQIGLGDINFQEFFGIMKKMNLGFIPEIWKGHLEQGKGFVKALKSIDQILGKVSGKSCTCQLPHKHGHELNKGEYEDNQMFAKPREISPVYRI